DLAVVDQHVGTDFALVGDDAEFGPRRAHGFVDVADLLMDGQPYGPAFGDLGPYAQLQADVLALYGLERVQPVGAGLRVLAREERHVAAHHDARFFVVEREQVGCGQHVGVAAALQGAGEKAEVEDVADAGQVDRAPDDTEIEARVHAAGVGGDVQNVAALAGEVRAADDAGAAPADVAQAGHPLDAEFCRVAADHFHDQAFHEDLGPAHVQLLDDGAQVAVNGRRRVDDQGIGGGVGLDGGAATREG